MKTHKLDNPAWYSLHETHKDFGIDYDGIKFYKPDYCPFGGTLHNVNTQSGIAAYASLNAQFFVIGDQPLIDERVRLEAALVCNQMILNHRIAIEVTENIVELRTEEQKDQLFKLVSLVQPGYFREKTADLGSYYGIYKHDQLIAVTGERMKMEGYTELSAIVTHPDHIGKGYAKQLIAHTSGKVFDKYKTPYLHVADQNVHAIRLYEKLRFSIRRKITFWRLAANTL